MSKTPAALFLMTALVSCKSTAPDAAAVLETPQVEGGPVGQGGAVVENQCNAGGHAGPTTGGGWTFSPKEGCFLDCKSLSALKQDYLKQLRAHRIFGDLRIIAAKDPAAAEVAGHFAEVQRAKGVKLNRLGDVTEAMLFDGAKWQDLDIKPGDVLLNFNFGQPNHAGIFYSKRGIAHARLVVKVTPTTIYTFDGGWEQFSKLKEVNAQSLWLRPRAAFLKPGDVDNLVKWAETMEPVRYDNTLVDDWREFRAVLHAALDGGSGQTAARQQAFAWAAANGKPPGSLEQSFSYKPPSGLYCSEGAAGIFSYLGFRQYGETAVDIITAFSKDGGLPVWKLYEDALSGFGADSDQSIYMMHKLFFGYFTAFEQARQAGVIQLPGTFAQAVEQNLKAVEADGGTADHLKTQLDDFAAALSQGGSAPAEALSQLQELKAGLAEATAGLALRLGTPLNLSQAVYALFYANRAYGPHLFFENGKYFELQGVFYNSNLQGNQALYISDWWMETVGQPRLKANIQTTLYRITGGADLPDDECVVGERAPIIPTH